MNPNAVTELQERAALAAAGAVKAASPSQDVRSVAMDAALSVGVNPSEASAIAFEIARQIDRGEREILTSPANVRMAAEAAAGLTSAPSKVESFAPQPVEQATPGPELAKAYRDLVGFEGWVPLQVVAPKLGISDPEKLKSALGPLVAQDFVRIENEHLYVTDKGRRFLEYASLA